MHEAAYARLIWRLCQAKGINNWRDVVTQGRIEVGGRVVGLVHDGGDLDSKELSLHVEFEPVVPSDDGLYLRLLQANIRRHQGLKGRFGVHPDTGNAVYSLQVNAGPELDGARLAELVRKQVAGAAAALDDIRTPR